MDLTVICLFFFKKLLLKIKNKQKLDTFPIQFLAVIIKVLSLETVYLITGFSFKLSIKIIVSCKNALKPIVNRRHFVVLKSFASKIFSV